MQDNIALISKLIDSATGFAVAYSFQILGAIIVLLIGLKVANWAMRLVIRQGERKGIDVTLTKFLASVARLVLIAFVVVITLGNFGITITPLIAAIGAAAFGATVAVRGILANFGAGLSVILSRPFVVGDSIAVKTVSGVVEEITLGATYLAGDSGERISVPNRQIVGEILTNWRERRMIEVMLKVGYDHDPDQVLKMLREIVESFPEVLKEPGPQVGIQDLLDSAMSISLRYWVPNHSPQSVRQRVNRNVLRALADAGIGAYAPKPLKEAS